MSAVDSHIHHPVIHEQHRHESPDIIDVDAFDADDIVYVGSARPLQRRRVGEDGRAIPVTREVIHVPDNEDDNEIQFIGHNPARPWPPLVRRERERIFSPPPPPQIAGIPPVPRIPQRFLTLSRRPSPGPIIPNEDPFPFEADLRPPVEQPAPVAASPSHHVPSMGFGGALLAGVQRMLGPHTTSHQLERRNSWGVSRSFVLRWDPVDEDDFLDGLDEVDFLGEDHPFAAHRVRSQIERAFKQRDHDSQAGPDYIPEYTHPDQPLPGFAHDFSPSPSSPVVEGYLTSASRPAGSSASRSCEVALVCAVCHDPLVLGGTDIGEGRTKRKLWGLRCGHLLDGRCIEKLMEPAPVATALVEHPPSSSQDTIVVDPDAYSMRSRLRPRRGMPGSLPSTSHHVPATPSNGRRSAPARAQTANRNNRKGKGKMKAPAVEAEHEWACPVNGCGHVHVSQLIDGRWSMDEKRGAIAVFV